MNAEEIHALVKHDLIRAAQDRHQTAVDRQVKTAADLTAAKAAFAAAKEASNRAIAGDGDLSALDAESLLEAATRVLSVNQRVHDAAELARQTAHAEIDVAQGEAHKPVYLAGVARRLAAAQKADVARRDLAAAEADYATATAFLNHASANSTQHVIYDQGHSKPLVSYADEVARWSHPNGWWDGKPV